MSELKPCPFCGCENIEITLEHFPICSDCGCSQDNVCGCDAVSEWNQRAETETEKRLTAIATKHATRADELYEKLEQVIYCSDNNTGHEPSLSCFQRAIEEARETLDKPRIEAGGE